MAYKEDIRERIRKVNPAAIGFIETIAKEMGKEFSIENAIITTEDMTPEEKKMVFLEYYLKQGVPIEEAEELAENDYEELKKVEELFKEK